LVVVGVDVASYEKAVEMISAKYGTPTYARWQKDGWHQVEQPSFSRNSAFNWTLKGGRIRVGRLNKPPFVLFIRNERDEAVANSFSPVGQPHWSATEAAARSLRAGSFCCCLRCAMTRTKAGSSIATCGLSSSKNSQPSRARNPVRMLRTGS